MARRRLVAVVTAFAVIAAWVGWWQSGIGLSAIEQELVGTWKLSPQSPGRESVILRFTADRRCVFWIDLHEAKSRHGASWRVNGDLLTIDREDSAVRRTLRPLGRFLRVRSLPANQYWIGVTADALTMIDKYGKEQTATRVSAD
jgi:hypothetical protein